MTRKTKFRVGIVFYCLSFVFIAVFFAAEYTRKMQVSDLEHTVTTLSERVDVLEGQAQQLKNKEPVDDKNLLAEASAITRDLAKAESSLQRPSYLSNSMYITWVLFSIMGSCFTVAGALSRNMSGHGHSENAG